MIGQCRDKKGEGEKREREEFGVHTGTLKLLQAPTKITLLSLFVFLSFRLTFLFSLLYLRTYLTRFAYR